MWVPNTPTVVLSALVAGAGGMCLLRDLMGGPMYDRDARADGMVAVVTGGAGGIGRETAWELAHRGAKVFLACRDLERCEAVRRDLVLETGNKYVYCRRCDLADLASVRAFATRFRAEEPRLDLLVCNAAVMRCPRAATVDGIELQLATNHLGHFLLANLLLPSLRVTPAPRVLVVTCAAHAQGRLHADDLNLERGYDPAEAYNQSKLANVLFVSELARRTLEDGVCVLAVDPGLTETNLTRHMPVSRSFTRYLFYPLFWPFTKSPRAAAQSVLHAALHPSLQRRSGDYLVGMQRAEPAEVARDYELARWLWLTSAKWTRLHASEPATNV